jgi:hypothetical protein
MNQHLQEMVSHMNEKWTLGIFFSADTTQNIVFRFPDMTDPTPLTKKMRSDDTDILFVIDGDECQPAATESSPKDEVLVSESRIPKKVVGEPANVSGVICKYFASGSCANDAKCLFTHIAETGSNQPLGGGVVCQYYQRGSCREGTKCRFVHPVDGHDEPDRLPCKYVTLRSLHSPYPPPDFMIVFEDADRAILAPFITPLKQRLQ